MKKPSTKPGHFWMSWGLAKLPASALPVSALDRPAVFETVRVYEGRAAGLALHLERLRESARTVGMPVPSARLLAERLGEAVRRSGHAEAIARLSVHSVAPGSSRGSVATCCLVRPFAGHPEVWYTGGIHLKSSSVRRMDLRAAPAQVKGNDYVNMILSLAGHHDVHHLFLNADGAVAESTVSNVLMIRGRVLWTPSAACGILLGVTRRMVLRSARMMGLEVREAPVTRHDLFNADEVFVTSAAAEVLPVVKVDARRIGSGHPGPWALRLRDAYRQSVLLV